MTPEQERAELNRRITSARADLSDASEHLEAAAKRVTECEIWLEFLLRLQTKFEGQP